MHYTLKYGQPYIWAKKKMGNPTYVMTEPLTERNRYRCKGDAVLLFPFQS